MPSRMLRLRPCVAAIVLLACTAPWPLPAGAQAANPASAPTVTDADIARVQEMVRKQMEQLTDKNIEATRQQHIVPLQQKGRLDAAINANSSTAPKLDALPTPQNISKVDIGTLADQYGPNAKYLPKGLFNNQPKLLIFITLGMPEASLKSLIAQAEPANASLVLRGFHNNSLQQTSRKIQELLGGKKVGFAIDPDSFDRYGVRSAPSFVLVKAAESAVLPKPCSGARCEPADSFALISGDVSLDYALESIGQRAPAFRREAQAFLKKIKG